MTTGERIKALRIQQRIASKFALYNLARVWYNKGTKCDDVGRRRYMTS